MDGLFATLLLIGAGLCAAVSLVAAKRLRVDAWLERAASIPACRTIGKGFAMAGWMMLASVGAVTLGFVPSAWLTSPAGATWFALALLGSLATIAWSRSVLQVRAASTTSPAMGSAQDAVRKAA